LRPVRLGHGESARVRHDGDAAGAAVLRLRRAASDQRPHRGQHEGMTDVGSPSGFVRPPGGNRSWRGGVGRCMRHRLAPLGAAVALAVGACTSSTGTHIEPAVPWVPASAQLTSYDSCEDALEGVQRAVMDALIRMQRTDFAYGGAEDGAVMAEEPAAGDTAGSPEESTSAASHSETNTAVAGVDEPDVVKTDGEFVYSVV